MTRLSIRRRYKRYPDKDECVPVLNLNALVRQSNGRTCIDLDDKQLEKLITQSIIFLARERMSREVAQEFVDEATVEVMQLFETGPSERE